MSYLGLDGRMVAPTPLAAPLTAGSVNSRRPRLRLLPRPLPAPTASAGSSRAQLAWGQEGRGHASGWRRTAGGPGTLQAVQDSSSASSVTAAQAGSAVLQAPMESPGYVKWLPGPDGVDDWRLAWRQHHLHKQLSTAAREGLAVLERRYPGASRGLENTMLAWQRLEGLQMPPGDAWPPLAALHQSLGLLNPAYNTSAAYTDVLRLWAAAVGVVQQRLGPALLGATQAGPERVFAFDTETNGLWSTAEILEIAVQDLASGKQFTSLIDCLQPWNADAAQAHHVYPNLLAGSPLWPLVGVELLEWLLDAVAATPGGCARPLWLAHNASFDVRRVGGALMALGFTPPPTWASLDTQWLAKASFDKQPWQLHSGNTWKDDKTPSFNLQVLEQQLGVTRHGDAHRAASDVATLLSVCDRLLDRVHTFPDNTPLLDKLPWALQELKCPPVTQRAACPVRDMVKPWGAEVPVSTTRATPSRTFTRFWPFDKQPPRRPRAQQPAAPVQRQPAAAWTDGEDSYSPAVNIRVMDTNLLPKRLNGVDQRPAQTHRGSSSSSSRWLSGTQSPDVNNGTSSSTSRPRAQVPRGPAARSRPATPAAATPTAGSTAPPVKPAAGAHYYSSSSSSSGSSGSSSSSGSSNSGSQWAKGDPSSEAADRKFSVSNASDTASGRGGSGTSSGTGSSSPSAGGRGSSSNQDSSQSSRQQTWPPSSEPPGSDRSWRPTGPSGPRIRSVGPGRLAGRGRPWLLPGPPGRGPGLPPRPPPGAPIPGPAAAGGDSEASINKDHGSSSSSSNGVGGGSSIRNSSSSSSSSSGDNGAASSSASSKSRSKATPVDMAQLLQAAQGLLAAAARPERRTEALAAAEEQLAAAVAARHSALQQQGSAPGSISSSSSGSSSSNVSTDRVLHSSNSNSDAGSIGATGSSRSTQAAPPSEAWDGSTIVEDAPRTASNQEMEPENLRTSMAAGTSPAQQPDLPEQRRPSNGAASSVRVELLQQGQAAGAAAHAEERSVSAADGTGGSAVPAAKDVNSNNSSSPSSSSSSSSSSLGSLSPGPSPTATSFPDSSMEEEGAALSPAAALDLVTAAAAWGAGDPASAEAALSSSPAVAALLGEWCSEAGAAAAAGAWRPFTAPLEKVAGFTEKQAADLHSAGFTNLLQLLLYTPKEVLPTSDHLDLADPVLVEKAGTSGSGMRAALLGRHVAWGPLMARAAMGCWGLRMEVDTQPSGTAEVSVLVSMFGGVPHAMQTTLKRQKEALAADLRRMPQGLVLVQGKLKQDAGGQWLLAAPHTTPPVVVPPDGPRPLLLPRYSDKGALKSALWSGTPGRKGLIARALEALGLGAEGGNVTPEKPAAATAPDASSSSDADGGAAVSKAQKRSRKKAAAKGGSSTPSDAASSTKGATGAAPDPCPDPLPSWLVEQLGLLPWGAALAGIHTPLNWEQYRAAQTRLAFQELLCIQLAALLERQQMLATVPSPSSSPTASTAASTTATTTDASSDENGPAAAGSSKRGASGHGRRKKLEAGDGAAVSSDEQREAASPSPSPSPAAAVTVAAGGVGPSRPSDMSMANQSLMEAVRGLLPYTLTASQQEVLGEVLADLGRPTPAMRLVQGEVGCGKTVVALLAMCCAVGSGWQAALMAPTELLAVQHYQTLWEALEGLPLASRPRLGLLTSSLKAREARAVRAAAAAGELDLVVGTHSLLNVPAWARLGLVVVDEQHKFGVKQREALVAGLGYVPHLVLMTATPIPRTLALVRHGALLHSAIRGLPPGRSPITTRLVVGEDQRHQMYAHMRQELDDGGRVYIVCPLVSASGAASLEGVKAAEQEHALLSAAGVFGSHAAGLLHGRMTAAEKAAALQAFQSGETPVLISSTVVEVGIDEPQASIMVVENAARFGLAQLHQLRGRVGRGSRASTAYLVGPDPSAAADEAAAATLERQLERLRVLEESQEGPVIAEADLRIRGTGDLFGTKQSGRPRDISATTWALLQEQPQLLEAARGAAAQLLVEGGVSPALRGALLAYGYWGTSSNRGRFGMLGA